MFYTYKFLIKVKPGMRASTTLLGLEALGVLILHSLKRYDSSSYLLIALLKDDILLDAPDRRVGRDALPDFTLVVDQSVG